MKRILLALTVAVVLTFAVSSASAAPYYGHYYRPHHAHHAARHHAYRVHPHHGYYYRPHHVHPRYHHHHYYRPGCYGPGYPSYYPGGVYFGTPHYSFGIHW